MSPIATPFPRRPSVPAIFVTAIALFAGGAMLTATAGPRVKQEPRGVPLAPFVDPGLPALTLPYTQTFNGALTGWVLNGKWHVRQNPQTTRVSDYILDKDLVTLPDDGQWPSAFEGTGVLVYSDDEAGLPGEGTFVAPWDTSLSAPGDGGMSLSAVEGDALLPQLDLTGVTSAQLSIWTWFEIESVDPAPDQFDAMLVQASTDLVAFTTVGFAGPAVDYNGNGDQPATSGGFNVPGRWVRQVYDLSSLAGQNVWLRLRFQSNDELYNAFRGWFVDSLAITANAIGDCAIQSVSPSTVAPGAPFLITGSNFVQGSTVKVGTTPAEIQSTANTTLIEAVAPDPIANGTYDVTVTAPGGTSCTLADALTIDANATSICEVEFAAPFCLQSSNGTQQIVLTGRGFQPGSVVYVEQTAVIPTHIESGLITFTLPALPTGFYEVTVRTPQGLQCDAGAVLAVDPSFCTAEPCNVTNIAPTCVKPGQGAQSQVTLTGTNLSGAAVLINNAPVNIVTANATQIVFDAPAAPDGLYAVQVFSGGNYCLAPRLLQITNGTCSVPTLPTTWGRLKATYR